MFVLTREIMKNNGVTDGNAVSGAKAGIDLKHILGWTVNAERAIGIGFRVCEYADHCLGTVNKNHIKRYGSIAHGKSMYLFPVKQEQHTPGFPESFAIH